jgi:pilus assembly protein Flp/PilA
MKKSLKRKQGQTLTEYIIIIAIVAIAAIAIVGVFSDRVRSLFGFAATELGADSSKVQDAASTASQDVIKQAPDLSN